MEDEEVDSSVEDGEVDSSVKDGEMDSSVFGKKKQRELKVARIRKKSDFKLLFIHYQL